MGDTEYRNVRLTEEAYRQLAARKRAGESFSDTVERISGERSLTELADVCTDEEADAMREVIRDRDDQSRDRLDRFAEQMNS